MIYKLYIFVENFRQAFEQAGRSPGCVFKKQEDIDIEKIKQSKYFRALTQSVDGNSLCELVWK